MKFNVKILRFDPEKDKKSHWEVYPVEAQPGRSSRTSTLSPRMIYEVHVLLRAGPVCRFSRAATTVHNSYVSSSAGSTTGQRGVVLNGNFERTWLASGKPVRVR